MMKKYMLLGLLGIMWGQAAFAQFDYKNPKQLILAKLEVEGTEHSDKNSIKALSGLSIGQLLQVPGQDISNVVKRLWKEGIFSDVRMRISDYNENTVSLVIEVTERPRISSFTFEGVSKSQADDLKEKINFIRGTILTESKEQTAKRIIRNFYVEKGFYNTKVAITSELDRVLKNGVAVTIKIDKGKKLKIDQIAITGDSALKKSKIKKKLKKVHEKSWWRFWARSKYVPKEYKEAKGLLLDYYNELGYRDAKIERDSSYLTPEGFVRVILDLYEGQQYYHRDIKWAGNLKYNSEILSAVLGIKQGDIYNGKKLQERLSGDPQKGDVSSLYLDDGYLFFNVNPIEVLVEGDSIDLEIQVTEGPQANIKKIIIEGNDKTSDFVILREMRTTPGIKFSRADIIRTQREVLALNYFNQETMDVQPIPDIKSGTVDIKYKVEERPSDQLQLQGGWGGRVRDPFTGEVIAGGFVGTVQLAFNNFASRRMFNPKAWRPVPTGDGQRLTLAFQMNGVGYKNFTVSFLEPWLGGNKPNSLGVNLSYLVFQNRSFGGFGGLGGFPTGGTTRFRNGIFTGSIDFGQRLKFPDDFFKSFTSLGYKYYDIQNPANFFPGFENESQAYINIITLKQTFDRTSIDAPIYPRSGAIMNLAVEFTPPYSLFNNKNYSDLGAQERYQFLEYHKWKFNSNWFWNIAGDMVLSAKVEAGYLGSYSKRVGIPPFERFTLGGAGLLQNNFAGLFGLDVIPLRGYEDQTINNGRAYYPIYNRFVMELRYPLTLNQSAPVWVALFAEGGNGYARFRDYNPFDIKRTAGAGLRVMLPMVGLLGLDWAYGFDVTESTNGSPSGSQFHFIIGQQF